MRLRTIPSCFLAVGVLLASWTASRILASDEETDFQHIERMIARGEHASAETALRSVVAAQPSARAWYLFGFALLGLHRYAEAEEALRHAVEEAPEDHPAMHALAKALIEQGRNSVAGEVLDRAIALDPNPEYRFAKAMCALNMGDLTTAESELRQCLERKPRHPAALYNLGKLLVDRGDHAASSDYLRRCLEEAPGHLEARFLLGLVETRLDRPEAAVESYEQVLERVPGHVGALYNLGRVLLQIGRREEGLKRLEEFQSASKLRDEIDFVSRALKKNPRNLELGLRLGELLLEAGRAEEALRHLLFVRQLAPERASTYRLLAQAYRRFGREEDAARAEALTRHQEAREP